MALDRLSLYNYSINLTDMPDEEARKSIQAAVRAVSGERKPWVFFKRAYTCLKERGLRGTVNKILEKLKA